MLGERAVPEHAKKEGSDQDIEKEHEGFGDDVGLVFGLDDFFEHLLCIHIFF